MKAITAYNLCVKHGVCHRNWSFKDFKWAMNLMYGKKKSWEDKIRSQMMAMYLTDTPLPEDGIYIPEVKLKVGGTMTVRLDVGVSEPAQD